MSSVNWPEEETLCLIKIWKKYLPELKAHKRNAHLYAKISLQLTEKVERDFTSKQVATKIENLGRKYRKEKSKLVAGSAPSKWKFYNIINDFLGCLPSNDDSLMEESFLNDRQLTVKAMQDVPGRSVKRPQCPTLDVADQQLSNKKKKDGSSLQDLAESHRELTKIFKDSAMKEHEFMERSLQNQERFLHLFQQYVQSTSTSNVLSKDNL